MFLMPEATGAAGQVECRSATAPLPVFGDTCQSAALPDTGDIREACEVGGPVTLRTSEQRNLISRSSVDDRNSPGVVLWNDIRSVAGYPRHCDNPDLVVANQLPGWYVHIRKGMCNVAHGHEFGSGSSDV